MAADLDRQYQAQSAGWTKHGIEFDKWIWEGHKIAQTAVYGALQPKVTVEGYEEHPDCEAERTRNSALHLRVDEVYQHNGAAVAEEQIAKAGYRLAEVLNSIGLGNATGKPAIP